MLKQESQLFNTKSRLTKTLLSADMGSLICRGLIESANPGAITRCRAAVCQSDGCNNYNFRSDPEMVSFIFIVPFVPVISARYCLLHPITSDSLPYCSVCVVKIR